MKKALTWLYNTVLVLINACTGCSADDLSISNLGVEAGTATVNIDGVLNDIWNCFAVIGIGLTLAYFLLEVNRRWALEGADMNFKSMFAPFLKLVVCIAVLSSAGSLFSALLGINDGIISQAQHVMEVEANLKDVADNKDLFSDFSFWVRILIIFPMLLGVLVAFICKFVWIYKAVVYKVELLGRVTYAPIALADVYSGQNSNGLKYIKGFLGHILYGVGLVVLPRLVLMVFIGQTNGSSQALFNMPEGISNKLSDALLQLIDPFSFIIAPIAAIGMASVAKSLAREAIGA